MGISVSISSHMRFLRAWIVFCGLTLNSFDLKYLNKKNYETLIWENKEAMGYPRFVK